MGVLEGIIVVIYCLTNIGLEVSLLSLIQFTILLFCGICLFYSLWFITATLNFHFERIENAFSMIPGIAYLSKFPPSSYPDLFRRIFSVFIPILVMTALPAEALRQNLSWLQFSYGIAISITFFALARWFWRWSLRKYNGASI